MLAFHVLSPKLGLQLCLRSSCASITNNAHSSSSSSLLPFSRYCSKLEAAATATAAAAPPTRQASMKDGKSGEHAKLKRRGKPKLMKKTMAELLRKNWLNALSSPHKELGILEGEDEDICQYLASFSGAISCVEDIPRSSESCCVLGIDPDVSGALAVLRTDSATTAEVFDVPMVQIMIGNKRRQRHDARSMVELIKQVEAPHGSLAYIEQNVPQPQNGKQGWWGSGFGFGIWVGVLVASGFTVVPVPATVWKRTMGVAGSKNGKDESRIAAGLIFPSLSSKLRRKKDHGRAEALLIAAFGKGIPAPLRKDAEEEEKCESMSIGQGPLVNSSQENMQG